jgi:hypothetical protein
MSQVKADLLEFNNPRWISPGAEDCKTISLVPANAFIATLGGAGIDDLTLGDR